MPRLSRSEKLVILQHKLTVLDQFSEEYDEDVTTDKQVICYELNWLNKHTECQSQDDKERMQRNKGFDLAIQDEMAAKYGLGPTDRCARMKNVYSDYRKVRRTNNTVEYELRSDSSFHSDEQLPCDYMLKKVYKDESDSQVIHPQKAETVEQVTEQIRSGYSVRNSDESRVGITTDLGSSPFLNDEDRIRYYGIMTSGSHSMKKQVSEEMKSKIIFNSKVDLVKKSTYGYPSRMCVCAVMFGDHEYSLYRWSPPRGQRSGTITCLCGRTARIPSGRGPLFGRTESVKIISKGRVSSDYLIKVHVGVSAHLQDVIHFRRKPFRDKFIQYALLLAEQDWLKAKSVEKKK